MSYETKCSDKIFEKISSFTTRCDVQTSIIINNVYCVYIDFKILFCFFMMYNFVRNLSSVRQYNISICIIAKGFLIKLLYNRI